jgi:AcrR family transcriptional regulator
MVGVVPNAAYRHFAGRDELLAAVCAAAMREFADRMAAGVARVPGQYDDPAAAGLRLHAIGVAYLGFAREEPGLFATAFALPQQHAPAAVSSARSTWLAGASGASGEPPPGPAAARTAANRSRACGRVAARPAMPGPVRSPARAPTAVT